ncbi:hypothetical protein R5R35_006800 [Gryllus longicercus]|uniref:Uncharacterized protein n=1 Tax=Gryllus longicercus TaxID=2509291 RepID=A0AAN9VD14_9ORTH
MTSCDLFRFIRTHKKQISTVDEKTVRVDFLTLSLYNEGVDLRQKIDTLENNLKQLTLKRNALLEQSTDDYEFDRVDHHGANQYLHQLIMVLRKWLTEVRGTLNVTFLEAVAQNEEIERLKAEIREGHNKVHSLKVFMKNQQNGSWNDKKNDTSEDENSLPTSCLYCNGDSKRKYAMLGADKGIRLASAELKNIKISLANIKLLMNQTEEQCLQKLSHLATRVEYLNLKLNSFSGT